MAETKRTGKKQVYTQQAIPSTIYAGTKMTVKVRENYFSAEAHEERVIPEGVQVNLDKEWQFLWDDVVSICEEQLYEIVESFKSKN